MCLCEFLNAEINTCRKPVDAGFTLLEVMIAVVILVVGLIPIGNAFSTAMNSIEESNRLQQASSLLNSKLQELKGRNNYSNFPQTGAFTEICPPNGIPIQGVPYTFSAESAQETRGGDFSVVIIRATVQYPSRMGPGTRSQTEYEVYSPRVGPNSFAGGGAVDCGRGYP